GGENVPEARLVRGQERDRAETAGQPVGGFRRAGARHEKPRLVREPFEPGKDHPARPGVTRGRVDRMIDPAPCSVNSSSRQALGSRPSRMTAARTPSFTAFSAVSTLGIIPPEIVPSAIIA